METQTTQAEPRGRVVEQAIDGRKLRDLRLARGWTQSDLSRQSGVEQATISRLERGRTPNTYGTTIQALARTLGVEPAALMPGAVTVSELNMLGFDWGLWSDLTDEERDMLLDIARTYLRRRRKKP